MAQMVLRAKLDRARNYWRALAAAEGALWTLAVLLLAFLVCFHVDLRLVLSIQERILAWWALGALGLALAAIRVVRPALQPRSPNDIAVMVERRYPWLRERLLSAVEFAHLPEAALEGMSRTLVADIQAEAEREAASLKFEEAFSRRGLRRAAGALAAALALLLLHLLFAGPAFAAFLSRMALNDTPVWRDTRVQVEPLEGKVLKNTDLTVTARQEGKRVRQGRLHFRFGQGRWNRVEVRAEADGTFRHRFVALTEPVAYYVTAGDGISDTGIVRVVDPAAIVGATLTLHYPAYMQRPPSRMRAEGGGIAAPVGTRVELELEANKPLETAQATLPKVGPTEWSVRGRTVTGSLVVLGDGQYTLRLKDRDGFFAPEPQSFPIKAIPDRAPEVQLLEPTGDLDVVPDARVRLSIAVRDDYGVAEVRVPYDTGRARGRLPAGTGGRRLKTLELESLWSLAPLGLKPGDTVRYRVEATDFDDITGPHVGRTGELQLHVIDRGEAERRYEEQRNDAIRQLQELIREQRGARADVEAQRRAARPRADALAAAEERQRNAAATTADLARRIAELNRMAETNRLASPDELEAQRAAAQSLNRLSEQEMPQAANRVGSAQARAANDPQGARSELGEASRQQQQILQELNRIAGQMRPMSEIQRLAERLERLAQEQRNLRAQTDRLLPELLGRRPDELTEEQRNALQRSAQNQANLQRATQQALQDLQRASESRARPDQAEAARQALETLQQGQVTEQQQQAAQETQQNALGQARARQENAARQLEQAARQLRSALAPDDPAAVERRLRAAMEQVARLLRQQQEAMERTRRLMRPEEQQELARQQQEMERQARELARQLQRLQRRTPSAGRAAQNLDEAGDQLGQSARSLSQGRQQEARNRQQSAARAMQRAMESLQQAMAEARGEEDPFAELRQELRRLAEQQRNLQQSTRRLDEQQNRNGSAPDPAELDRLARQQGDVESALERLEPRLPGEISRRVAQEGRQAMSRSQQALRQGNTKPDPTQKAQQRALTTLEQLAKALEQDSDDSEPGASGSGGDSGGQGGGQPDPDLPKRIAELRLLRMLEQGIRTDTQELDDARSDRMALTEEQKARIAETARRQAEAKSLAEKLAQGLGRYRRLADRVRQAGRHMDEARRGLEQQETGEGVQEQETQAILRLSEALRQAQQQQQAQQRQQRRQQQQAQQAQQPSGGTPQGQQQGNQPALQSLQRRAGLEAGRLGGLGAGDRGFAGLDPRAQDALRQSFKERKPAEYQDLINRYFSALSRGR